MTGRYPRSGGLPQPIVDAPDPNGRQATWIIPFVLACVLLSDRLFVPVASGGRGVLHLLALVAPLAALAALARYGTERSLGFLVHPAFVVAVLPYLALTAVLPILGVMVHDYPERTLLAITDTTTALSFLVLGAVVSTTGRGAWARWLLLAIAIEFAYALGQVVYWSNGPGWEFLAPLAEWDRALAELQGQLGSLGRSTGLFANPNDLGLWAAVAVVLAGTLLTGWRRSLGMALAGMTLLLSQSRGATVALVLALLAAAALAIARGRLGSSSAFRTTGAIAVGAVMVVAIVNLGGLAAPLDRFGALGQVLTEGPQADPNLAYRLELWTGVIALNSLYPLGTWGSPELVLGAAVDSLWFRVFAQGSVIYLAALAALVAAALALRNAVYGDALRLVGVVVAVAGLTQVPFGASAIALFWVLLGIYLQAGVMRQRSARSERPGQPLPRPVTPGPGRPVPGRPTPGSAVRPTPGATARPHDASR